MKLSILVADDESLECDAFEFLAFQSGIDCTITKAKNGKEALEKARETRPQLIVLDIQMPVMNGLEAAAEIRKFLPKAMIVFLTAWGRFDFAQKALRLNATDYLVKPVDQESVASLLRKCESLLKSREFDIETPDEKKGENSGKVNIILDNAKIQKSLEELKKKILKSDTEEVLKTEQFFLESVYESLGRGKKAAETIEQSLSYLCFSLAKDIPFLVPPEIEYRQTDYLENILANFIISATKAIQQDKKDKYQRIFNLIFTYIENHYMEELDTEKLCSQFSLHPGYFPQLFKKYSDTTFIEFLTKTRLIHASEYLREGNSVKEAARKSGFSDTNYFSKVFRKHFCCTPSEYSNQ